MQAISRTAPWGVLNVIFFWSINMSKVYDTPGFELLVILVTPPVVDLTFFRLGKVGD